MVIFKTILTFKITDHLINRLILLTLKNPLTRLTNARINADHIYVISKSNLSLIICFKKEIKNILSFCC